MPYIVYCEAAHSELLTASSGAAHSEQWGCSQRAAHSELLTASCSLYKAASPSFSLPSGTSDGQVKVYYHKR